MLLFNKEVGILVHRIEGVYKIHIHVFPMDLVYPKIKIWYKENFIMLLSDRRHIVT